MSRALKDLVLACVLTLMGLAVGLWLAGADAHAAPADRRLDGACPAGFAAGGNGQPPRCGSVRRDASDPKSVRPLPGKGHPAAE